MKVKKMMHCHLVRPKIAFVFFFFNSKIKYQVKVYCLGTTFRELFLLSMSDLHSDNLDADPLDKKLSSEELSSSFYEDGPKHEIVGLSKRLCVLGNELYSLSYAHGQRASVLQARANIVVIMSLCLAAVMSFGNASLESFPNFRNHIMMTLGVLGLFAAIMQSIASQQQLIFLALSHKEASMRLREIYLEVRYKMTLVLSQHNSEPLVDIIEDMHERMLQIESTAPRIHLDVHARCITPDDTDHNHNDILAYQGDLSGLTRRHKKINEQIRLLEMSESKLEHLREEASLPPVETAVLRVVPAARHLEIIGNTVSVMLVHFSAKTMGSKNLADSLSLPIIVISTLTGTVNLMLGSLPRHLAFILTFVLAGLSTVSGLLSSVMQFLAVEENYAINMRSEKDAMNLIRDIDNFLCIADRYKKKQKIEFLRECHDRLISLFNSFCNTSESSFPKECFFGNTDDFLQFLKKSKNEKLGVISDNDNDESLKLLSAKRLSIQRPLIPHSE